MAKLTLEGVIARIKAKVVSAIRWVNSERTYQGSQLSREEVIARVKVGISLAGKNDCMVHPTIRGQVYASVCHDRRKVRRATGDNRLNKFTTANRCPRYR